MSSGLFQSVSYVGHQGQVTGFIHGLSHFALEFQASARDAAGQQAALLVHEFQQKVRVFIVHVLNAIFLEAAVLVARVNGLVAVVAVVVAVIVRSHRICVLEGY